MCSCSSVSMKKERKCPKLLLTPTSGPSPPLTPLHDPRILFSAICSRALSSDAGATPIPRQRGMLTQHL